MLLCDNSSKFAVYVFIRMPVQQLGATIQIIFPWGYSYIVFVIMYI